MSKKGLFISEINRKIKRGYVDRLTIRANRMRKLFHERNWRELKLECRRIEDTASEFGFGTLRLLAHEAQNSIPRLSGVPAPQVMKVQMEDFFSAVDEIRLTRSEDVYAESFRPEFQTKKGRK